MNKLWRGNLVDSVRGVHEDLTLEVWSYQVRAGIAFIVGSMAYFLLLGILWRASPGVLSIPGDILLFYGIYWVIRGLLKK